MIPKVFLHCCSHFIQTAFCAVLLWPSNERSFVDGGGGFSYEGLGEQVLLWFCFQGFRLKGRPGNVDTAFVLCAQGYTPQLKVKTLKAACMQGTHLHQCWPRLCWGHGVGGEDRRCGPCGGLVCSRRFQEFRNCWGHWSKLVEKAERGQVCEINDSEKRKTKIIRGWPHFLKSPLEKKQKKNIVSCLRPRWWNNMLYVRRANYLVFAPIAMKS